MVMFISFDLHSKVNYLRLELTVVKYLVRGRLYPLTIKKQVSVLISNSDQVET